MNDKKLRGKKVNCKCLEESEIVREGGKNPSAIFVLMNHNNLTLEESQYYLTINEDNSFVNEKFLIL